jgi:hypothetical protein
MRAACFPLPASLGPNMCVFTHSFVCAFSGKQPLKVGNFCQPKKSALQMLEPCSQNCNCISNKAPDSADQSF